MRVLILAPAYHPHMGGAETYARVLAEGIAQLGDAVTVVTDGTRVGNGSGIEAGVRVERVTGFAEALTDGSKLLWEQMAFALNVDIARLLDGEPPDVVVANSNDTALLARMIGDHYGVPVVGSFHEQEPELGPLGEGRARLVYQRLGLDGILAGSDFYARKATAFGATPTHVHHIPHGVDTDVFSPGPLPPADGPYRVTLSGRIAPRKQQVMMVEVVRRLRDERGIHVDLTLAGRAHSSTRSYHEEVVAAIGAADLGDRVHIEEDLGLLDMPDVYRSSHLVVQPSLAEGLGLAVLEAMACGRPVVVGDTTGLREVIRSVQHGIRLDPQHVDAWVDVVDYLRQHPDVAAELGRNGRELVLQRFRRDRMITDTRRALAAIAAAWVYPRKADTT